LVGRVYDTSEKHLLGTIEVFGLDADRNDFGQLGLACWNPTVPKGGEGKHRPVLTSYTLFTKCTFQVDILLNNKEDKRFYTPYIIDLVIEMILWNSDLRWSRTMTCGSHSHAKDLRA
jgi:hypothetical protein